MKKSALFVALALFTLTASAQDAPTPSPTPAAPPAARAFSIYSNGVYAWPGDYSYAATINYKDTAGKPPTGTYDIAVTTTAWGAWQPYATNWNFNRIGYNYLVFKLKPTRTDSSFTVQFLKVGDVVVAGPGRQPSGWL